MSHRQPARLLTAAQVAERLNVSIRTVWLFTRRGWLPEPVRLTRKFVRWKEWEIERFIRRLPT